MRFFLLFLVCFSIVSCAQNKKRKVVGKSEFQIAMNAKFKDASTSPLTKKDLKKFKGLDFFEIDDTYKVLAKIKLTPDAPVFEFPTTTDRIAYYKKYGMLSFTIDNEIYELAVFKDEFPKEEYKNHLFLPFLDETNGKTSYKGGRFVDLLITDIVDNTIEIDFNKAYNPYCVYSDRYSCPITPRDNYLPIEIKAGVMAYKK